MNSYPIEKVNIYACFLNRICRSVAIFVYILWRHTSTTRSDWLDQGRRFAEFITLNSLLIQIHKKKIPCKRLQFPRNVSAGFSVSHLVIFFTNIIRYCLFEFSLILWSFIPNRNIFFFFSILSRSLYLLCLCSSANGFTNGGDQIIYTVPLYLYFLTFPQTKLKKERGKNRSTRWMSL